MKWAILTTGPYMEQLNSLWAPIKVGENYVFRAPIEDGAMPFIYLGDLAKYARWLFDNTDKSSGSHTMKYHVLFFRNESQNCNSTCSL
jgi:hypothetical protein